MDRSESYKIFARWCFSALAVLNVLDLIFTFCFIRRYGTGIETNPCMAALWDYSPWAFVFVKLALSALLAGVNLRWRGFKRWFVVAAAPALFYGYVVVASAYFFLTLPPG